MMEAEITVATRTGWGAAQAFKRLARAVRCAEVVIEEDRRRATVTYPEHAEEDLLSAVSRLRVAARVVICSDLRDGPSEEGSAQA